MNQRVLLCTFFLCACAKDRTITRGAEGVHDWQRRLETAIPIGTTGDSATRLLVANGFNCPSKENTDSTIWCDKYSGGRFEIVRRRWQALLHVHTGRVISVRASTGLIGP